jgi:plastocyanin
MKKPTYVSTVVATVALLSLAGCGGSSDDDSGDSPQATVQQTSDSSTPQMGATSMSDGGDASSPATMPASMITISDFDFGDPITVSPGATVMVMNGDTETHTVTADSASSFDATVTAGGTAMFTAPTKPGTYPFHCNFHADMHGTLTVT